MHKKAYNDLPTQFIRYFKKNKEVHNYDTRNAKLIHKSNIRNNYGRYIVRRKGIEIWNSLSDSLK